MSAAVMAPTALSILMTTFDEGAERNRALGVWSAMGGLGATAALLIGGTLTQALGWEWVFFLNVPVAVALLLLSPVLLDESRDAGRPRAYDPGGAVAITAALVLLIDAIVEAPGGGWTSPRTIGLLAGTAALVAIFARIEARLAAPLVPLRVLRSRTIVGGNLATLLLGMAAWGMGLTVAEYAQRVLGYSPLQFGAGTVAMTGTTLVGSYAAQRLVSRVGAWPVAAAAMVLVGAGVVLLARVSVHGTYVGDILPGLLVFGPGWGAAASRPPSPRWAASRSGRPGWPLRPTRRSKSAAPSGRRSSSHCRGTTRAVRSGSRVLRERCDPSGRHAVAYGGAARSGRCGPRAPP